ncbi:bifunctional D-glycero-beta-D-manno-heptose-7-phosphate kinase/D-glycero-beta-D-manno-heptose 1-phosphate adenylyltransferase HldE [Nitrococcus mobilis]|uniref:Bifunctional protein HldE n=1 Tax=Nitrococcus mobilis Nb-231 TaxID=314278 RepID=A4BV07_9GAMM|nr:bifunctional D-glycero-beta-D-manno-heptose-7-phosphate kinase/D-glycero-beta-D-manno-heptose 1-phosphate adenylyltransferase HldE [Nitrococcus mobilis]EAR20428.1 LPS biosynthesis protein RfaE [Nitrococcus mobilis Nb-231]
MRIPDFHELNVLVAGDAMLDRYWYGEAGRISPEAPVPVVAIARSENRPGGAANVALALAALGVQTTLVAPIGHDEAGTVLRGLLAAAGVRTHWLEQPTGTTITKLRIISQHQQMLRVDFEGSAAAVAGVSPEILGQSLSRVDAVIFSDYAKGALAQVAPLIHACREAGRPVLIDPKRSEFAAYAGASVLTPNRAEFERMVGRCGSEFERVERARELLLRLDLTAMLLTRGEEGMTLIERDREAVHIAARAQEVFDVTGAGDTVVAVLGAALAAGEELAQAAALANLAAGVVVGKLGTATVSLTELHAAAQRWLPAADGPCGIVTEGELIALMDGLRQRQDVVVMTNGCFDILHPGHIAYLEQAKACGDWLIVAVNDDDSVRRLKGRGRPINPLAQRMAVLAGLAAVDWVVSFSEDTPVRLIEAIGPDVLVKGGDYRLEEVAGHEGVLARGGQVRLLPLEGGYSTTGIVERIYRGGSRR